MTEIFKFTSLARNLVPLGEDDLSSEATYDRVTIICQQLKRQDKVTKKLHIFWDDQLIIRSSNHQVEFFDATHLKEATEMLLAIQP